MKMKGAEMGRFKQPPIERHEALAPFSRDHYTGLVQARRLIKSAEDDAVARRKAIAEFVDAWDQEIAEHFDDEERLLMDVMSDDDRQRLTREHVRLRSLADEARGLRKQTDPDASRLQDIGQTLDDHIRWEERELFARIQDRLDEAQLAAIGHHTASIEAQRPRNTPRQRRG